MTLFAQRFSNTLMSSLATAAPEVGMPLSQSDRDQLNLLLQRVWDGALSGHACLELGGEEQALLMRPDLASWFEVLGPLALSQGCLYLQRFLGAEQRVAKWVRTRSDGGSALSMLAQQALDRLECSAAANTVTEGLGPEQVLAVRLALGHAFSVIFGGPGTGKTRTIAAIVMAYVACSEKPVWLAAPTAKAGARLMQSLQHVLGDFGEHRSADHELVVHARSLLPAEARTVHRLISDLPSSEFYFYDHDHDHQHLADPSPGLIILDEASMVSLELCDQLFARIPTGCQLLMVGDPDQLHSVETGSMFASLCRTQYPPLKAVRVELSENFRVRNRPQLVNLARGVLSGEVRADSFGSEVKLEGMLAKTIVARAVSIYADLLKQARPLVLKEASPEERARLHLRLSQAYRLLSARRTGALGADRLSKAIFEHLAATHDHDRWFEGRLIILRSNHRSLGLSNGDTGVCVIGLEPSMPVQGGAIVGPQVLVAFERDGGFVLVPPALLVDFQDAYCLSVHQAQGSEFEAVDFVAAPAEHALATRELLYTAITRARERLHIFGEIGDVLWAAKHPTLRSSRLAERIEGGL
jgi:exodeoxyribonuclease V alpha subunit